MKKLAAILILSIFASTAHAEDWVEAGETNDADLYIDADSIKDKGKNQKVFWVNEQAHKAQKAPNKKLYTQIKFRVTVDCENDTWFQMEEYYYNKNGELIDRNNDIAESEVIVPESMAHGWQEYVCD